MKSRVSISTIALIVLFLSSVIGIYSSYKNLKEHNDIDVAWTVYILSKYNINDVINGVNGGYIPPNEATVKVTNFLQEIKGAGNSLSKLYYGGDELVTVNNYLDTFDVFVKPSLDEAISNPNPKRLLGTPDATDERRVETEHTIEESELRTNLHVNLTFLIILFCMALLSWRIDTLDKKT